MPLYKNCYGKDPNDQAVHQEVQYKTEILISVIQYSVRVSPARQI